MIQPHPQLHSIASAHSHGKVYVFFYDTEGRISVMYGPQGGIMATYEVIVVGGDFIKAQDLQYDTHRPLAAAVYQKSSIDYIHLFYVRDEGSLAEIIWKSDRGTWNHGRLNDYQAHIGQRSWLSTTGWPSIKIHYVDPSGKLAELWWDNTSDGWTGREIP